MTDIREGHECDNAAVMAGYTKEVEGHNPSLSLYLLVKPDADLDSTFKAWDMDEQAFIRVNGWLFSFEEVNA